MTEDTRAYLQDDDTSLSKWRRAVVAELVRIGDALEWLRGVAVDNSMTTGQSLAREFANFVAEQDKPKISRKAVKKAIKRTR